jgi:hypothetical protein
MAGHSLGGGLAAANSKATGVDAYTFNAAGLSEETKNNPDLVLNFYSKIDAYVVQGEIVSAAQGTIGLKADGTIHVLPATYSPMIDLRTKQRIDNHSMSTVIQKMKESGL